MPQLERVKKALNKELKHPLNLMNLATNSLIAACINGDIDVVKFLINELILNTNIVGSQGMTPLMFACISGHLEIAKFLVEHGNADVNATSSSGTTSLMFACNVGHVEIVDFLVNEAQADLNLKDDRDFTALSSLHDSGHPNKGKLIDILTKTSEVFIQEDNNSITDSCIKDGIFTTQLTNQYADNIELIGGDQNTTEDPASCVCIIS